jgi:hypothetical protein
VPPAAHHPEDAPGACARAMSGQPGRRRADRPCRAAAARRGLCARPHAPARRGAAGDGQARRPRPPRGVRPARAPWQNRLLPDSRARERPPLLRDHGAGARVDDRQGVLVAVGVDANRVVQFICKHQTDPPTRRVRFAGLEQGKPRGRSVMSHTPSADRLLDQANSGRHPGAAVHTRTIHCEGTTTARHLMSHKRHDDNQPRNGPSRTDPTTLTDP